MEKPKESSYYTLYHFFRERFVLPARQWLYRFIRTGLLVFIIISLLNFVFAYYFNTPKTYRLNARIDQLVFDYHVLQNKVDASLDQLTELRERDHLVYRTIFSEDTLNIAGIYNPYPYEKYTGIGYGRYTPLMVQVWEKMDAFARELYLQSVSYDRLERLAQDKDLMAEVVPAIMPVDQKQVTGIGKFGGRFHPVLKTYRKHDGMDFAAKVGTPVYAAGTGLVEALTERGTGYGLQIIINHGFGYKTRYAHLSKQLVSPGDLVVRGEKIGEVGNTGLSSGSHLHYEVIYRGTRVDPINYFSRDMTEEEYQTIISKAQPIAFEVDDK